MTNFQIYTIIIIVAIIIGIVIFSLAYLFFQLKKMQVAFEKLEQKKDASDFRFVKARIELIAISMISLARHEKKLQNRSELEQEFNYIANKISFMMPNVEKKVIRDVLIVIYTQCFNIHV